MYLTLKAPVINREGAENSGGKRAGPVPVRCIQVNRRSPPLLAPQSLTTQVPANLTGQVPKWSDSEVPAVAVTGSLPVYI